MLNRRNSTRSLQKTQNLTHFLRKFSSYSPILNLPPHQFLIIPWREDKILDQTLLGPSRLGTGDAILLKHLVHELDVSLSPLDGIRGRGPALLHLFSVLVDVELLLLDPGVELDLLGREGPG